MRCDNWRDDAFPTVDQMPAFRVSPPLVNAKENHPLQTPNRRQVVFVSVIGNGK